MTLGRSGLFDARALGVSLAREHDPTERLPQRGNTRFCSRCQHDVHPLGGVERGPLFICASCKAPAKGST